MPNRKLSCVVIRDWKQDGAKVKTLGYAHGAFSIVKRKDRMQHDNVYYEVFLRKSGCTCWTFDLLRWAEAAVEELLALKIDWNKLEAWQNVNDMSVVVRNQIGAVLCRSRH